MGFDGGGERAAEEQKRGLPGVGWLAGWLLHGSPEGLQKVPVQDSSLPVPAKQVLRRSLQNRKIRQTRPLIGDAGPAIARCPATALSSARSVAVFGGATGAGSRGVWHSRAGTRGNGGSEVHVGGTRYLGRPDWQQGTGGREHGASRWI